jgi:ESS family glutamate:Na+ symporter
VGYGGLLLLRILNADYSTNVGMELAFFNVAILFTTLPVLINMAPQLPGFGMQTIMEVYELYSVICFGILLVLNNWQKSTGLIPH